MNEPLLSTIKRLFAFSRNRCAFPDCSLPIVEDSGVVTGIVCHIKARSKGGPRYDAKQTDQERHAFENLVLMCGRHSKLIDSDPKTFTVTQLQAIKSAHEQPCVDISRSDAEKAEALLKDYRSLFITAGGHVMLSSPGAVQATNITIKTTKSKIKLMPAAGTLGSDGVRRNYVKHLIDRYNHFASQQKGRKTPFSFTAIYSHLKKKLGADWERIPLTQFDAIVSLLQNRIDKTRQGSINRGNHYRNYSRFEEYQQKYASGDKS